MTNLDAILERQVWNLLNGRQAHLAVGGDAAKRVDQRYGPFAAMRDNSAEAQAALAGLIDGPQGELWLVETTPVVPPPGLQLLRSGRLLQMLASETIGPAEITDAEAVPLTEEHAAAMCELALATKPGPWVELTHRYGPFYGIFRDGRLAAMAGERMLPGEGVAEVSGVCTWPECQGQGLGGRLTRHVMAMLRQRGDRPYLHTYADNAGAVGLYRKLGFREHREMTLTILGTA